MQLAFLNRLGSYWRSRTLRTRLFTMVSVLMAVSLLGSIIVLVIGTRMTESQYLESQMELESSRATRALLARAASLPATARLLAEDHRVADALNMEDFEQGLAILNSRALIVRDRYGMDLIQIYDARATQRTNLLVSSLYRESSLLRQAGIGVPVIRHIENRLLLLCRASIPANQGYVVVGIDLEAELGRLVVQQRLTSELGLIVDPLDPSGRVTSGPRTDRAASHPNFPFAHPEGAYRSTYGHRERLTLGASTVELIYVRTRSDVAGITSTALIVMTLGSLATTSLLLALSVLISKAMTYPLKQLTSAVTSIAQGDLTRRVTNGTSSSWTEMNELDEVSLLTDAFNRMGDELQSLYQDLESRVEARTRELQVTAEIARCVSSSLDLSAMLHTTSQTLQQRLNFRSVTLLEGDLKDTAADLADATSPVSCLAPVSLISEVIATAAATQSTVIREGPGTAGSPDTQTCALAAVPLIAGRATLGVMLIESPDPASFHPEMVNLLTTIADQVAIGIHNAKLYRSEQERRQLAEMLELSGRALSGTLEIADLPGRILAALRLIVHFDRAVVWLQRGDALEPLGMQGFAPETSLESFRMPVNELWLPEPTDQAQPTVISGFAPYRSLSRRLECDFADSGLRVPLVTHNRVIGMILLIRCRAQAFQSEDIAWARSLAIQAAIALENASLYAQITRMNEHLEHIVAERTAALRRAYHAQEQLDTAKRHFITIAAHELRTPLAVIRAYGQTLRQSLGDRLDSRAQRSLNGMLAGAEQLNTIIGDVLDVARIESNLINLSRSPTRLSELIHLVVAAYHTDLLQRHLSTKLIDLESLPVVQVDRTLFHKALDHLFSNAMKYTPDGGTITIAGRIEQISDGDHCLELAIRDSGIGIAPEQQQTIFSAFSQRSGIEFHSSGRTKFKGGGLGLGLALVQGIIQAHGGRIWVESEGYDENRCPGSVFIIQLPLDPDKNSSYPLPDGAVEMLQQ